MNVLAIVGSPRRRGNTARLVEAVVEGALEAGHEADIFYLCDLEIGPIEERDGEYFYPEDDMARLYPHIERMDALILGTPVYYDHVSSRTKLFIDRLHYYSETHGEEYRRRLPKGVKVVNLITYEWDKADAYEEILEWMNGRMEGYWDMKVAGNLKAEGTEDRAVSDRAGLLEKARDMGKSL